MEVADFSFRAMGSQVHAIVVGPPPGATRMVKSRVDELERLWSRFDPDSEISRLNRADGARLEVSPETITLLSASVEAWKLTGGLFDPTVFGALVHAGDTRGRPSAPGITTYGEGIDSSGVDGGNLEFSADEHAASLPPGVGFDPGGIGKGLAADLTVLEVLERGARGAMVNVGGDLRAEGLSPTGNDWTAAIEDPTDIDHVVAVLHFTGGGVATSSTTSRTLPNGQSHLLDPTTGHSLEDERGACTVLSSAAWLSEAFAKAALIAGPARDIELLDRFQVAGMVVSPDGIRLNDRIGAYL